MLSFWMDPSESPFTLAYLAMLDTQHHKAVASGICLLYRAKTKNKLRLIDVYLLTLNRFCNHELEEPCQKMNFTARIF